MAGEVGYKKPPVHTRFQKGRSGNPGGRPGPTRQMEQRFGRVIEAALMQSRAALARSRPSSTFERLATELVHKAAKPNVAAIKIVVSFLPSRGDPVRRARLPAGMLDELMQAYLAERASALRQAQGEALRQAQGEASQGLSTFQKAHAMHREVQDLLLDAHRERLQRIRNKAPQGISAIVASHMAVSRRRLAEAQGLSRALCRQHRAKCRAIWAGRRMETAQPP